MPPHSSASARTEGLHGAFVVFNAVLVCLFSYILLVTAFADNPNPDEAVTFLGLQDPHLKEYHHWPYFVRIVAFVVYHYLGIHSAMGFQLLGALLAIAGAAGVNVLLFTRVALPKETRVLCAAGFNVLLITSTDLHQLTVFAILAYPMRVFAGFLFIYLLVDYSAEAAAAKPIRTLALGAVLGVLTFVHPILVLPLLAVYLSLIVTRLVRKQALRGQLGKWVFYLIALVILPAIPGALVVFLAPHREMSIPRDAIRGYYFFLNESYPKNPIGFFSFVLAGMKGLFVSASLPWSLTTRISDPWPAWAPLFFFSVGTMVSFFRRNEFRFLLALFVCIDLSLRLGANLAGSFPFAGDIRYALSQTFGFALLMALGGADILIGAARLAAKAGLPTATEVFRARWSYACSAMALIAGSVGGMAMSIAKTQETLSLRRDQAELRKQYGVLRNETVVLDTGMLQILHYYLGEAFFDRNDCITIPKMFIPRDITPAELKALKAGISHADVVYIATKLGFNKPDFREAYDAVDALFKRVSIQELLTASFSVWELEHKRPTPGVEHSRALEDAGDWTAATKGEEKSTGQETAEFTRLEGKDGDGTAFEYVLNPSSSLFKLVHDPISAGTTVSVATSVWSDGPVERRGLLRITLEGQRPESREGESVPVDFLIAIPRRYKVSHTFDSAAPGYRLGLHNVSDSPIRLRWKVRDTMIDRSAALPAPRGSATGAAPANGTAASSLTTRIAISVAKIEKDGRLTLRGWAVSGQTIAKVILRGGKKELSALEFPLRRPDILARFPEYGTDKCGFSANIAYNGNPKADPLELVLLDPKGGEISSEPVVPEVDGAAAP